uniref:Retrotransposon gag domain-containing protein n=1 Tax=Tanacetum cinerariifolium TaxID=118510 RepID=A0A699H9P3_TANCI|nr:hypothetical protein [Tanacetum cinerariifolium]
MTRSLTKELFTPFKDPKREFRSSRKHFKTLSLDESRFPNLDLFSEQEEYLEEEVTEIMAETIKQYISETRADYGLGIARPKIEDKDSFELKGQFLKELRDNTLSGSDHEDANEHIEKVLEIVDLFCIPNITIYQVMLRAFPMSLTGAVSRWLKNKPSCSITTWEDLKTKFLSKYCPPARTVKKIEEINNFQQEPNENLYQAWERFKELLMKCLQHYLTKMQEVVLFYNGLDVPTRQILNLRGAIPSKTATDAKSISTIVEVDSYSIRRMRLSQHAVSTGQNRTQMYETKQTTILFPSRLNGYYCKENEESYGPQFWKAYSYGASYNSIPRKEKDPGSFTLPCFINNVCFNNALADLGANDIKVPLILERPFLSTAHAKIDVFKRKITLRVGKEEIIFKSVKSASSLIKRVYMLSLRERMELDLEARLIGETLVFNRSLDPFFEDYIELNDLNVPLELRRYQVDDLMPTIKEGKVVEEFRAKNDARIFGYPSDCNHDKKIRIDFLQLEVLLHDRDKMENTGNNVVGALKNIHIFVGTFSTLTDFAVLENMDAYHDEGMGDVIFSEPFLREVRINAKRFKGMITIHNGNQEVTYQMLRLHPRFKHHTNEQCNKIPSLLKEDTTYLCLHSPKTTKETRSDTPYPEEGNTPYSSYIEIKYSERYQTCVENSETGSFKMINTLSNL